MQGGLSLFRSSMTLRMKGCRKGRYTNADYEPLSDHYTQRIFQVHAIGRYVDQHRSGGNPRGYVRDYFRMTTRQFTGMYFPDEAKALRRPVDADQHERIVTRLAHPEQERIVTAPRDRNMLILAGPGSGKTKVVVHRAAYLLTVEQIPPERILMICFNRAAAHELRTRLRALAGEGARGVAVHTYHSLALRLVGRSLASERSSGLTPEEEVDFREIIRDANRMLAGDGAFVGHDTDTLRDRLLAGYEYVLVDEYQDIDEDQYTMLTHIARRAGGDTDTHAAILAVGDDDQSIYEWRGANTELIRQFQDTFDAEPHHLVENYRSTQNIITVANRLISHNADRVKKDHPIRVNTGRANDPAGGDWEHLDRRYTQGRVLLLEVADSLDEPPRIAAQIERIKRLRPEHDWIDFAVLARSQDQADTNRAFLERQGIPVRRAVRKRTGKGDSAQRSLPWLGRIREFRLLIQHLQDADAHETPIADLRQRLPEITEQARTVRSSAVSVSVSVWTELADEVLASVQEQVGDEPCPHEEILNALYQAMDDAKRGQMIGNGVHVGTVHSAKGLEFAHVMISGSSWSSHAATRRSRSQHPPEEADRRLYYVAMTRASQTLTLITTPRQPLPFENELIGADGLIDANGHINSGGLIRLRAGVATGPAPDDCRLRRRYRMLSLKDMYISYAGCRPARNPIHEALRTLRTGSKVRLKVRSGRIRVVEARGERIIAQLSKEASDTWRGELDSIEEARILGLVQWQADDSSPEYRERLRTDAWEVPILEIRQRLT